VLIKTKASKLANITVSATRRGKMTIQRHFDFTIAIVEFQVTSSPPLIDAVYITGLELLDDVSTVSSYSDDEDYTIVSVESDSYIWEGQIPLAATSQKQRPATRERLSRPSRLEDDGQDSVVLTRSRVRGDLKRNQVLDEDSLRLTRNRLSTTPAIRNHREDECVTRDPLFYDVDYFIPLSPMEGDELMPWSSFLT
jgi:hypothetical protein